MSDDENDQSDEDVAYHELFENAQKAIHSSEANQRRSKAVREELEAYIDRASEMKGSDGSTLIRIPSNFETIVNSMNRDDLSAETSEEKPWSQYLLLDGLNAEDDKEYNGRYARSFRDTPDVKIKRGLAQIQLLDRQLQEITRATHAENETGSPRADETFITTKHARGTDELSPAAKKEVQRGHLGAQSKKTTNKYNIEKDQEQQRLAYLLSIEPDDEKGVESYWDPDLQAANEAIDERLAAFGRWGRGSTTTATAEADNIDPAGDVDRAEAPAAETTLNEATTGDGGGNNKRERKVDYLHELRAVRLENERMQRLDALIDTCSNHVSVCVYVCTVLLALFSFLLTDFTCVILHFHLRSRSSTKHFSPRPRLLPVINKILRAATKAVPAQRVLHWVLAGGASSPAAVAVAARWQETCSSCQTLQKCCKYLSTPLFVAMNTDSWASFPVLSLSHVRPERVVTYEDIQEVSCAAI